MGFKLIVLAVIASIAQAGWIGHAIPHDVSFVRIHPVPLVHHIPAVVQWQLPLVHDSHHEAEKHDYYAPAHYHFSYGVHDPHTHDIKSHEETRHGDVVKGSYTLLDADHKKRIVHYSADKHSGFNAVVEREPTAHHHEHLIHHQQDTAHSSEHEGHDYHAPANYHFAYGVHDPHTHDIKSQEETRHGDVVKGSYTLLDADHKKRIVHYSADKHSGFNAVVEREPTAHHHEHLIHHQQDTAHSSEHEGHDYHAPANYHFAYGVHDPHTHDIKSQEETRHGDVVKGSYTLLDADHKKRIVHYSADKHSGFNAVVEREPTVHHHEHLIHHQQDTAHSSEHEGHDYHAPANYHFAYGVHDPHTHDIKSQEETRHGDVVKGSYTLLDADHKKRIVHYSADKHSGFNAIVEREPTAHHHEHLIHHQQDTAHSSENEGHSYYAPANYHFAYGVHDPQTHDIKSQEETRHGDAVRGSYTLLDADHKKRIVHYSADKHSGFNAIVEREPTVHHHEPLIYHQQDTAHSSENEGHGYYAPANYHFAYGVHDPQTHDIKSQEETRHGDAVKGSYTLLDADHKKRIVHYSADKHSGFNAIVEREPTAHHHEPLIHHQQDTAHSSENEGYDYHAPANYHFAYGVHDPHTHDIKSQEETRHGDAVKGSYTLLDADHKKRIVHYSADKHSGFNAVVERGPTAHHHEPLIYHQQDTAHSSENEGYDYHAPANYHFAYGVHDPHTHDIKSQEETRHGDVVKGSYILLDADHKKRIVHYSADKHSGFNVHVEREPAAHY